MASCGNGGVVVLTTVLCHSQQFKTLSEDKMAESASYQSVLIYENGIRVFALCLLTSGMLFAMCCRPIRVQRCWCVACAADVSAFR